jgi:hypothetical protein
MKQLKQIATLGLIGLVANGLIAAESASKDKVTDAAKQLGDKSNYSWTTSMKEADGSPGRLGTIEGKAEKGGLTGLNFSVGDVPVQVFMKGDKGAAQALEGWQTFDEIAQTGGTAAAVVRFLRSYKAPVPETSSLLGDVKELKEADGAFAGDLQENAVNEMLLFGTRRREGQEPPKTTDAKGSVKFWIKDGLLSKIEINVQGKVTAGERHSEINRTTTVEIKDVDTTKLDLPSEAKQKLS